jgi:hypothetical protein
MRKEPALKSAVVKQRPLWRLFGIGRIADAADHAKGGGLAALATARDDLQLFLALGRGGDLPELAHWALLALEIESWTIAGSGPTRGLATVWIDGGKVETVRAWCERDEARRGRAERTELDCLACGACCRRSRVVLEPSDRDRFRGAGVDTHAYLRTDGGQIVLRRAPDGACVHFGAGNRCKIYELRPRGCRVFPVASEPCLAVRSEVLAQ